MHFLSETVRTVRLAVKALMLHKLRSGLTMLGIVFGVFSVIAMLAIGEGASYQAQQQVLALGANNIIVLSVKPPNDSQASSSGGMRSGISALTYGLLRSDYRLLSETLPTLSGAMPIREIPSEARYLRKSMNIRLVGCTEEYFDMNRLELQQGRFLTDRDQDELANVCVLAYETAKELFPFSDPLGESVLIRSARYKIVGVSRERTATAAVGGSLSGQEFNKDIYIPLRTLQSRIGDRIINRVSGSFSIEQVELNQITLKVRDLKNVLPTSEVVRESLARAHPYKKDWDVVVPLELLRQADQIRQIFNIVLGSIAAISLLVGGIGIMNIMLATVTERTREIGIRRALGARQRDIIYQFLTETVVLSGAGGIFGVALGLLTPLTFSGIQWIVQNMVLDQATASSQLGQMFSNMQPRIALWSLPVAFGISVTIGVIFGMYPAQSAARMDPIEALRHE